MARYIGEKCPVCGGIFTEEDDIVVCPQCGAPHHRDCWFKTGKCAFSENHGAFEWKPENDFRENNGFNPKDTPGEICLNCGANNPPNTLFCPSCGAPRNVRPDEAQNANPFVRFNKPFEGVEIDGVGAEDLAEFIGGSSYSYIDKFKTKRHNGFNWGAFLFGPWWFFYRKMYKLGAVFALIMAIISVTFMTPMTNFSNTYYDIAEKAAAAETQEETDAALAKMAELASSRDAKLSLLASALSCAVSLICGCIGNTAYRKYCTKTIREADYDTLREKGYFTKTIFIRRKGGVNPLGAMGAVLAYQMLLTLISMLFSV